MEEIAEDYLKSLEKVTLAEDVRIDQDVLLSLTITCVCETLIETVLL